MKNKTLFSLSLAAFLAAFLAGLWLAGLVLFVERVNQFAQSASMNSQSETDAIIALTGGSERVKTGIDLLRVGKGKKLLISGVFPGIEARHLLASSQLPPDLLTCCVILGHAAEDTKGNAIEARDFMKAEGFTSMLLVTAHYHMPRSLLLFRAMMPDVDIVPTTVLPDVVDLSSWWRRPGTLSLLIAEYNKYMLARLSLRLRGYE